MTTRRPAPSSLRSLGDGLTGSPALVAEGVGLTYAGGIEALRNVDLTVADGQFVSIVGPSGCGKSTFLKAVAGLIPITHGTLTLRGDSDRRADVAFVFQSPTLLTWRTVLGNVELPNELRGGGRSTARSHARELLALVGLADFADRFPSELSGGMQMRVSLARALMTDPRIMLLDEPFGALDDLTRQRLNEDLHRIWLRDRWTGLFVTHNVSEAVYLSDRVVVMSSRPGQIVADVPIELSIPRTPDHRSDPGFAAYVREIGARLREEV
ncbi:MAG: ABC transporter ATP-binding protein [Chthonomonadales bacterium]|nr:ABC transporter ATP-binding protein [Chthonomonadales bacterium]